MITEARTIFTVTMPRRLLAALVALALLTAAAGSARAHEVNAAGGQSDRGAAPGVALTVGNPALLGGPDTRPAHEITIGDPEDFIVRLDVYAGGISDPDD